MAPYFCHVHNGLYVKGDDEGCQHDACLRFRNLDVPPVGVVTAVVPGGANDTEAYRFHKDFDKGLDKYAEAKRNGLQPKGTTVRAVEAAKAEVASHERALKKLRKYQDVDGIKTVSGVEA